MESITDGRGFSLFYKVFCFLTSVRSPSNMGEDLVWNTGSYQGL